MPESRNAQDDSAALAGFAVSALANAAGGRGVLDPGLVRYSGAGTAAGPAVTADCDEGSLEAVWAAMEGMQQGAVLCIRGPGTSAYMGDMLASDLARRGVVAVIVDGYIRDRAALSQMGVTFLARGLYPMAHRRPGPGRPSVPLEIGGVRISPGDRVAVDDDGVIVIAPQDVSTVLAKAQENEEIEAGIRSRMAAGAGVADAARAELAARAAAKA